jgi:hypothetical protein
MYINYSNNIDDDDDDDNDKNNNNNNKSVQYNNNNNNNNNNNSLLIYKCVSLTAQWPITTLEQNKYNRQTTTTKIKIVGWYLLQDPVYLLKMSVLFRFTFPLAPK